MVCRAPPQTCADCSTCHLLHPSLHVPAYISTPPVATSTDCSLRLHGSVQSCTSQFPCRMSAINHIARLGFQAASCMCQYRALRTSGVQVSCRTRQVLSVDPVASQRLLGCHERSNRRVVLFACMRRPDHHFASATWHTQVAALPMANLSRRVLHANAEKALRQARHTIRCVHSFPPASGALGVVPPDVCNHGRRLGLLSMATRITEKAAITSATTRPANAVARKPFCAGVTPIASGARRSPVAYSSEQAGRHSYPGPAQSVEGNQLYLIEAKQCWKITLRQSSVASHLRRCDGICRWQETRIVMCIMQCSSGEVSVHTCFQT
jgi:hypothetical protein